MLAVHREAVELVHRAALTDGQDISLEDAAAALYFTRDLLTGDVDVERALKIIPGACGNPICLDSPPTNVLGRRARENETKRAATPPPHSGHCCPIVSVTAIAKPPIVQGDAPQPAATSTPAYTTEQLEAARTQAQCAADEIQRKQTAAETIQLMTGCTIEMAEHTLSTHLKHTTSFQHARFRFRV